MKKKYLLFLLLFTVFNIYAQKKIKSNNDSIKIEKKLYENNVSKSNKIENQEDLYKLLYENSKDFNEQLTTTIQWTIGLSLAFLLAIFGSQIFFNWRVNKKDLESINKDIMEKFSELKADILKEITQNDKLNKENIDKIFVKMENKFSDKINEDFKEKQKQINLIEKLSTFQNESTEKSLSSDLKRIKNEIEKINGDIWNLKGVKSNALSSYVNSAISRLESGEYIKYLLDEIITTLKDVEDIHDTQYKKLDELVLKIEGKYDTEKELIKNNYLDKPVYEFTGNQNPFFNLFPSIRYIKNKK
ncbi:hypothetical protein G6R40_02695 [Chryseobacterium sp. POL2]|uniref:hypothetical protein n=1 Tax=Chryseobacterium sp. POL2 TaxID=2713414 RepID=UPI0013E1BE7A|nr:hypothetical protein [Chryseobacterium sp. POL2]QIG88639.1 hypothetical protein G6R40_02695 [Chryseobacterium sp. POL2]